MKKILLVVCLLMVSFSRAQMFEMEEKQVKDAFSGKKSFFKKGKFEAREQSSNSSSLSESFSGGNYENTLSMRAQRRVGVGFQIGGQAGQAGINLELNITPENAAILGFGGGPKYNTFNLAWKYVFGGEFVAPYFSTSFARWYNSGRGSANFQESNPSFLAGKFLTADERQSGLFGKDLLIPALGLQMNMLKGPYAGYSLYTEIMLAINLSQLDQAATGSMGLMYYF